MTTLPPIPDTVPSMLGPVAVVFVVDLTDENGDVILGDWDHEKRRIRLRANMHPTATLVTLWHERIHMYLCDAGIGLSPKDEERVADAISTALVHDVLNRRPV